MAKFRYSYSVTLDLAFPNTDAPEDFGVGITNRQIRESEKMFNVRFRGRKELSIYNVEDHCISMLLLSSYEPENVTREVSAFSQILVKEYNFDKYSAKQGRLFNANAQSLPENTDAFEGYSEEEQAKAEIAIIEQIETDQAYKDEVFAANEDYIATESIRMMRTRAPKRKLNTFVIMSNEIIGTSRIDRLDNYIKQLEDLTILAKAKRSIMIRSKK